MAANDIYRVEVRFGASEQRMENVFHYRTVTATSVPTQEAQALADTAYTEVADIWPETFAAGVNFESVLVTGVTDPTVMAMSTDTPVAGTIAGGFLPPQAVALALLRTGLRGRSFQGRCNLPPPAEVDQNGGLLESSALSRMGVYITNLMTLVEGGAGTGTWNMVVYSRKLLSSKDVTSFFIEPIIHTQRRRTVGRGT